PMPRTDPHDFMLGMQGNYPENKEAAEEEKKKQQEEFDKTAKAAMLLTKSFGALGAAVVAAGFGVRRIAEGAEQSAQGHAKFSGTTMQALSKLERDRIKRERDMARATAPEAKEFLEAENRAEQATQGAKKFFQKLGYKIGTMWENTVEQVGTALGGRPPNA